MKCIIQCKICLEIHLEWLCGPDLLFLYSFGFVEKTKTFLSFCYKHNFSFYYILRK